MNVANWDVFPTELQAELIQTCPTVIWRVVLYGVEEDGHGRKVAGVAIRARRDNVEAEVRVPITVIEAASLPTLLDNICAEADKRLTQLGP